MFLHSYSETSWTDQLTKESLAERTIRATVHARKTLLAGFTTVRYVHPVIHPTEAQFWLSVTWERKEQATLISRCVNVLLARILSFLAPDTFAPIVLLSPPEAMVRNDSKRVDIGSGITGPKSSIHPHSEGIEGVTGAEVVDGIDECVKAVRRQVGAGVDWIKVYLSIILFSCHYSLVVRFMQVRFALLHSTS